MEDGRWILFFILVRWDRRRNGSGLGRIEAGWRERVGVFMLRQRFGEFIHVGSASLHGWRVRWWFFLTVNVMRVHASSRTGAEMGAAWLLCGWRMHQQSGDDAIAYIVPGLSDTAWVFRSSCSRLEMPSAVLPLWV
jgi:hypothetical protein